MNGATLPPLLISNFLCKWNFQTQSKSGTPFGRTLHPKNKRMTHIICVVRFYLPEMTIFLPLKTLYRQKEVKKDE